jgi:hypothetical protein
MKSFEDEEEHAAASVRAARETDETGEKLPGQDRERTVGPESLQSSSSSPVSGAALSRAPEGTMGYREAREVARIRQELRERLMSDQHEGAAEVLARLRYLAEDGDTASPELRAEYERWRMRFELLAQSARSN